MRNLNKTILSAASNQTTSSTAIDTNQTIAASFHAFFGDTQAAGSIKIEVSNDIYNARYNYPEGTFVPTAWTILSTTSVASGASKLITVSPTSYRWMRATYADTATGAQTITTVADVASSLQSTYFFLNAAVADGGTAYYVWINVDSGGIDPMIPSKTGVEVDITAGASADDVATAVAAAIDALAGFASTATGHVATVTNTGAGPFTPAIDFDTTFAFAITSGGSTTVTINMNALSM